VKDYEEEEIIGIERELEGIKIVEKISILGVIIYRKLEDDNMNENWRLVENKMINISRYWNQFSLSIAGRVMIAKTYLISQAVYLMGLLNMSDVIGDRLNNVVINYVKGHDRAIAQNRWYLEADKGGYGIIDMIKMNRYIKASWIIKWKNQEGLKDYVKERIMGGKYGNIERIDANIFESRYSKIGVGIGKNGKNIKGNIICLEEIYKWQHYLVI
jgi:hypothetical protein